MGGKKKRAKNAGKKAAQAAQMKAEQKRKKRIIEDKTFGLKNKKKSSKVKKYIAQVTRSTMEGGDRRRRKANAAGADAKMSSKKKKALKAARDRELAQLFGAINLKKKPKPTAKPKKADLHTDLRTQREADTMDKWDQSKLEEVVAKNETKANKNRRTDIVCKYFLDAIEKEQYGWFWVCPNGGDKCMYRHALPPGYVFKTRRERELDKLLAMNQDDAQTIEQIIEEERAKLPSTGLTPVTLETFTKWKEDRRIRKEKAKEAALAAAQKKKDKHRSVGNLLSGRALFSFDPSLFVDDDAAGAAGSGAGAGAGAGAVAAAAASGSSVSAGAGGAAAPVPPVPAAAGAASAGVAPPVIPPPAVAAAATDAAGGAVPPPPVPPPVPAVAAAATTPAVAAAIGDASLYMGDEDDNLDDLDFDDEEE